MEVFSLNFFHATCHYCERNFVFLKLIWHSDLQRRAASRLALPFTSSFMIYRIVVSLNYFFYRAMHFSAYARSWDRMSSVRPSVHPSVCLSVRLSVTLVIYDHIGWKSWKLIARTISPTSSLIVAKRRSTYSQGNMGKFGGD